MQHIASNRLTGIVGLMILLFVFCFTGASLIFLGGLESSISYYYYTAFRNVFVSVLSATAFYFLTYRGYSPLDAYVSNVAAFFIIGVAWVPTSESGTTVAGTIHLIFATCFFVTVAFNLTFIFTKSASPKLTREKILRNRIYHVSALVVLCCLIAMGMQQYLFGASSVSNNFIFFGESIALMAIGFSYLAKAGIIFPDAGGTSRTSLNV